MTKIKAWVASAAKSKFARQEIDLGPFREEEVEVAVEYCGVCHSDLSMLNNDRGFSQFPAVLDHEVVGRMVAVGSAAKGITVGQRVGIGWTAESCMHCHQCMSGDHNLCAESTFTMVGHKGGFASHVRSHWAWAIPIPETLPAADAGPLLCGGVTVNVSLDWPALINTLAPNGRMAFVGFVADAIPIPVVSLIMGQRSISGSAIGSPDSIATMLEFAARHKITPQTEHFPMSRINEAFEHLEAGKARYRIVLDADFGK
ncbi:MAG: alcohol dehydrogenase catalytic domain-containing protein [Limisphaerales bacterium]